MLNELKVCATKMFSAKHLYGAPGWCWGHSCTLGAGDKVSTAPVSVGFMVWWTVKTGQSVQLGVHLLFFFLYFNIKMFLILGRLNSYIQQLL